MDNKKQVNRADFDEYFQRTYSMNAFSVRALEKIRQVKGHSFTSQTIRNLIFEEYQRLKKEGAFENEVHSTN